MDRNLGAGALTLLRDLLEPSSSSRTRAACLHGSIKNSSNAPLRYSHPIHDWIQQSRNTQAKQTVRHGLSLQPVPLPPSPGVIDGERASIRGRLLFQKKKMAGQACFAVRFEAHFYLPPRRPKGSACNFQFHRAELSLDVFYFPAEPQGRGGGASRRRKGAKDAARLFCFGNFLSL